MRLPPVRSTWSQYSLAFAAALLAVALTLAFPVVQRNTPVAMFFAAVAFTARFGGWGPSLVCMAVSAALVEIFVLPPSGDIAVLRDFVVLASFTFISALISTAVQSKAAAERKAQQALDRLSLTIERSNDAIVTTTLDGIFTTWNEAAERIYGYTKSEAIGRHISLVVPAECLAEVNAEIEAIKRGETVPSHETVRVAKDGSRLTVSVSVSAVYDDSGRPAGLLRIVRDVTEKKRADQRLSIQSQLLEMASEPIIIRDAEDRITYWNTGAEFVYGYTRSEAIGRVSHDLLRTQFPCEFSELDSRFRRQGYWNGELVHRAKDGKILHVISRWTLYDRPAGQAILETNFDVTALKQTQKEREDIIQRLEVAQQVGNMGAWEWLPASDAPWWSDGFSRLHQYEPGTQPSAEQWFASIYRDDRDAVHSAFTAAMAGKNALDVTYRVGDGTRWVTTRGQVLRDAAGSPIKVIGIAFDVTEQRKTEEAIRKTEKLAATGRLAATVAHEINNPLEAITNLLYLIETQPGLTPNAQEYLQVAQEELDRVSHIARQTLGFYRESSAATEIGVAETIRKILAFYRSRFVANNVSIDLRLDESARIRVLSGEFNQVISNLVSNACDAMPRGGHLAVRVHSIGGEVTITVADTGHGIAPEHKSKIFEAFYTTKKDVGTGLGLWVTQSILEKHNARIRVRSRNVGPCTGTVFVLTFKAASAQALVSSVSA